MTSLGKKAAGAASLAQRLLASFKILHLGMEVNPATALPELSVSLGSNSAEKHLEEIIGALDHYCDTHNLKIVLSATDALEIVEFVEIRTMCKSRP